jgi:ElaB/YqjD/DUF883 family membrane-anchored ribosome-binding protein
MTTAEATARLKDEFERLNKHTARAVEDARDEAAYCIKRRPLAAVAVAFGAGALLGIVLAMVGPNRSA